MEMIVKKDDNNKDGPDIFLLTTNKLQLYNVYTLRPFHLFLLLFSFSWFLSPFFLYLNQMMRVLMWSSRLLLSHFHPH